MVNKADLRSAQVTGGIQGKEKASRWRTARGRAGSAGKSTEEAVFERAPEESQNASGTSGKGARGREGGRHGGGGCKSSD